MNPRKPLIDHMIAHGENVYTVLYKCPECGFSLRILEEQQKYCPNCGIKLDWGVITKLEYTHNFNKEVEDGVLDYIKEKNDEITDGMPKILAPMIKDTTPVIEEHKQDKTESQDIEELINSEANIDFDVLGDIKPTVIEILGYYDTWSSSDCDYHLSGTSISLPGYWKWLTYYGWMNQEIDKKIIRALYEKGLIKIHQIR